MSGISDQFDDRVDVKNKFNQISQIFGELDKDAGNKQVDGEHIGGTNAVGNGEFNDLIGGQLNYKVVNGNVHVNDAQVILQELLLGDGIDGVELIGLDGDSFTIKASNGGSSDFLVFEGEAAEAAISTVDEVQGNSAGAGGFDLNGTNAAPQFAIFDAKNDSSVSIGGSGQFGSDDFGNNLSVDELPAFLEKILTGDGFGSIEIIDVDASSIALKLIGGNSTDTLLITGIEEQLAAIESSSNFDAARDDDNDFRFLEGNSSGGQNNGSNDLFRSFAGGQFNENDADEFLHALVDAGGELSDDNEIITLMGVDSDSFTVEYEHGSTTDIFVWNYENVA